MRVTQSMMTRQYMKNLNTNMNEMNKINNRILSKRKFSKASEDPVNAAKALNVRRNLEKLNTYERNLKTADSILSASETIIMSLSSLTQNVKESTLEAVNGTNSQDEVDIIANQLFNFADEMVKQLNTEFAGRQLFGGTNNTEPPFKIEDEGGEKVLYFNGVKINDAADLSDIPHTKDIYVDVGLGIQLGADGEVDPQTALKLSLNGAEATGYGVDDDGDPKNVVSLTLSIVNSLRAGDKDRALALSSKLDEANSALLISIADIGNRSEYIEFNLERVNSNRFNLLSEQNDAESIDMAAELINYEVLQLAYNATLQMGATLIPPSIFDYIR